jgi:hypothetical protein
MSNKEENGELRRKRKRAKRKTERLVERLEELGSDLPYEKARDCWRLKNGKSKYCKQRWCLICQKNKLGEHKSKYVPVLQQWEDEADVCFVTLTTKRVEGDQLRNRFKRMKDLLKGCRKAVRESVDPDLCTLEFYEVDYDSDGDTYHPHVHIATHGLRQGRALKEEWAGRWGPQAYERSQDVRKWENTAEALVEYCTGVTRKRFDEYPAQALDTIFRALRGLQVFGPAPREIQSLIDRVCKR